MVEPIIGPLFWALIVSVLLRKPKLFFTQSLEPFKAMEHNHTGSSLDLWRQKTQFLVHFLYPAPIAYYIAIVILSRVSCYFFGWGCWIPWLYITIALAFLCFVGIMSLATTRYTSYESLVSMALVAGVIFGCFFFVVFFLFQAVVETSSFFFRVQELVRTKVNDPTWAQMLDDYGITSETIAEHAAIGKKMLNEWLLDQGYYSIEETQSMIETAREYFSADLLSWAKIKESLTNLSYTQIKEIISWETLSSSVTNAGSLIFGTGISVLGTLGSIMASLYGMINGVLDSLVFIGALLYFVQSEEDSLVDKAFQLLPVRREYQMHVSHAIRDNITGVFLSSLLLCIVHGFATFTYFTLLGLDFAYSAAFITGAMASFPLLSPWMIFGPGLLALYLQGNQFVIYYAVALFISEWVIGAYADDAIFNLIPDGHPYFTAVAAVAGVSTFGVPGVLIGPMIIVLTKTVYELFTQNLHPHDIVVTDKKAEE